VLFVGGRPFGVVRRVGVRGFGDVVQRSGRPFSSGGVDLGVWVSSSVGMWAFACPLGFQGVGWRQREVGWVLGGVLGNVAGGPVWRGLQGRGMAFRERWDGRSGVFWVTWRADPC